MSHSFFDSHSGLEHGSANVHADNHGYNGDIHFDNPVGDHGTVSVGGHTSGDYHGHNNNGFEVGGGYHSGGFNVNGGVSFDGHGHESVGINGSFNW